MAQWIACGAMFIFSKNETVNCGSYEISQEIMRDVCNGQRLVKVCKGLGPKIRSLNRSHSPL